MFLLFMSVSLYAFLDWFTYLSGHPTTDLKDGDVVIEGAAKNGLFLLTVFLGSLGFGTLSLITYLRQRRIDLA